MTNALIAQVNFIKSITSDISIFKAAKEAIAFLFIVLTFLPTVSLALPKTEVLNSSLAPPLIEFAPPEKFTLRHKKKESSGLKNLLSDNWKLFGFAGSEADAKSPLKEAANETSIPSGSAAIGPNETIDVIVEDSEPEVFQLRVLIYFDGNQSSVSPTYDQMVQVNTNTPFDIPSYLKDGSQHSFVAYVVREYPNYYQVQIGTETFTMGSAPTSSPNGNFDGIDANSRTINGWSFDPDNSSASNDVHIYINGPAGGGGIGYAVTANQSRPDVNQSFGISGNHGFSFQIPAQFLDNQPHVVYVYGIDTGPDSPTQLNGSGQSFTLSPPPAPAPNAPTNLSAQVISQSQIDLYWAARPAGENVTSYNLRINGSQVITGITSISYPATGLNPGTNYAFEVQAVNSSGASPWSSSVNATTQAAAPTVPNIPANQFFKIIAQHSGKCLDVPNSSTATGTDIQQFDCISSQPNQLWKFVRVGDEFQIISQNSNKCFDVRGGTGETNNGAAIQQWDCIGASQTNQLWRVVEVGSNAYQIYAKHSSKCLDVYGGDQSNGRVMQQWTCGAGGQTNQTFSLVAAATITPPPATGLTNFALGKAAIQIDTLNGGVATRAVDGNSDGNWFNHSLSHTGNPATPWWQVDLGENRQITKVRMWNRTDCCSERLANFYVIGSNTPFASNDLTATLAQSGVWNVHYPGSAGTQTEIPINQPARYVRIQLAGTDYLSLAEVEILGDPNYQPPTNPPSTTAQEARQRPINATGGMNLYSRNFGWSTGLAGLSGRGINAGFGLSYNSLVWVKKGSEMIFNPNNDNVSPGFRFGYPVIEPSYNDSITGKSTYLMVTPSGARIGFRQIDGSSDTFETADSSYAQLKVINANTLVVTGTDGTRMTYELKNGNFYCSQIKDANGNFVTVNTDANGKLQSVTDTLGRVINVNYDGNGLPATITQQRAGGTHTFATFNFTMLAINTNFSGLNVVGVTNGASIPTLQKITYSDGSSTQFDYNSYGQVYKASNYAADNHKLNHTANNLDAIIAQPQTDAPRFTELKSWAENFNIVGGNAQEIVVPVSYQENQSYSLPDGAQGTGTLVQVTAPDGTVSKTFYGGSGWLEGLPLAAEDWTGAGRVRWNRTVYTQDNPNLAYILNPRVIEAKVGDNANARRTTIDYHVQSGNPAVAVFGLVKDAIVYDANGTSQLKRSHTEYNFDNNYISRRIIGLPAESTMFDESNNLMSNVTYAYDGGDFSGVGQNITPTQHDTTNYGAGFITGRGNLTSTTRWDVTAPTNQSAAVTNQIKYDIAGNQIAVTDPLNRTISTSYADSFHDNQNRNTFAYPTAITDPAGNSSTVKYRYDIGANVYATSPAPANNSAGKTTSRIYDNLGRLERETVNNTGAYTRYEYPTNGIQSRVFSTITDVNANGADSADEVLTESFADGAGRARMARTEHPGSTGGWSATLTEYDVMGRVKRSSVPTETDISWNPAGDDASRGWLWTTNEYDWKGRVTKTTNSDGTFMTKSYEGCGCAGGETVTIEGEEITETNWQGNAIGTLGKRKQKLFSDILGRTVKSQIYNWDGSIYSTVVSSYNGRDQVIRNRHHAGDETSNSFQDTLFAFDGHGRVQFQHAPEQANNTSTGYEYYANDQMKKKTDSRGATTNYEYNNRGLLERVTYGLPSSVENLTPWLYRVDKSGGNGLFILGKNFASNIEIVARNSYSGQELARYGNSQLSRGTQDDYQTVSLQINEQNVLDELNNQSLALQIINTNTGQLGSLMLNIINSQTVGSSVEKPETVTPTAPVRFEYDAAGNRTLMEDELGVASYNYDALSRMTSENRQISALNQTFSLGYSYGLSGQLKAITNPFNATVSYDYDKVNRLTAVGGTNYGISTPFVSNISYRAWGAMKNATYGYGGQLGMTYDLRLRPTQYSVTGTYSNNGQPYTRGANYSYYADGQLKTADDLANDVFDKSYKYDQVGRLREALSGLEARGETVPPNTFPNRPYKQNYVYNVWNNRTGGEQRFWRTDLSFNVQSNYINNRDVKTQYDADGRELANSYNSAGRSIEHISRSLVGNPPTAPAEPEFEIRQMYDGNGAQAKREEIRRADTLDGNGQPTVQSSTQIMYYIRSTVLGGKPIAEVSTAGTQSDGYIYAAGALLAKQTPFGVQWQEANPLTGSRYEVDSSGYGNLQERDPLGANTGITDPYQPPAQDPVNPKFSGLVNSEQSLFLDGGGDPFNPKGGCELDGMPIDCGRLERMADNGGVGADVTSVNNGRISRRHVSLTGSDIVIGRGSISVYIPGNNQGRPRLGQEQDSTPDRWETVYFSDVAWKPTARETAGSDWRTVFQEKLDTGNCLEKLDALLKKLGAKHRYKGQTGFQALANKFLDPANSKNVLEEFMSESGYSRGENDRLRLNVSDKNRTKAQANEGIATEFIHELIHAAKVSMFKGASFNHEQIVSAISELEGINFSALRAGQENLKKDILKRNILGTKNVPPEEDNYDQAVFEEPMNSWINKYCGGGSAKWDNFYQQYKK